MNPVFVIAGTDTGVGKTVFAAALVAALDGFYWKPIQAGLPPQAPGPTDSETVRVLSGLPPDRILPEAYRLITPASPHIAAARESITIDPNRLALPRVDRPLIVEGAGGLMVPLTQNLLQIDLFARWGAPVILCARTTLGTINHSLLSLEALRRRAIPVAGIAFLGSTEPEVEETIVTRGGVHCLGRLPILDPLTPHALSAAYHTSFANGHTSLTLDCHNS